MSPISASVEASFAKLLNETVEQRILLIDAFLADIKEAILRTVEGIATGAVEARGVGVNVSATHVAPPSLEAPQRPSRSPLEALIDSNPSLAGLHPDDMIDVGVFQRDEGAVNANMMVGRTSGR